MKEKQSSWGSSKLTTYTNSLYERMCLLNKHYICSESVFEFMSLSAKVHYIFGLISLAISQARFFVVENKLTKLWASRQ